MTNSYGRVRARAYSCLRAIYIDPISIMQYCYINPFFIRLLIMQYCFEGVGVGFISALISFFLGGALLIKFVALTFIY